LWADITDDHMYDADCEDTDEDGNVGHEDANDGDSGENSISSSASDAPPISH
jgi:hypothetical protein